ncbi:unnamed protein product [Closterium sp. Yama58-4]|nr:unnamed protein product [Closterium sp. Yama58-4]
MERYGKAIKLLPATHADRAILHSNRAACLLQMRPVDYEGVRAECDASLALNPGFCRALLRRAKALDALGEKDKAEADVDAILKAEPSNQDAWELKKRLQKLKAPPASKQPSSVPSSVPSSAAAATSAPPSLSTDPQPIPTDPTASVKSSSSQSEQAQAPDVPADDADVAEVEWEEEEEGEEEVEVEEEEEVEEEIEVPVSVGKEKGEEGEEENAGEAEEGEEGEWEEGEEGEAGEEEEAQQEVLVDSWIIQFADLFRERLGIDSLASFDLADADVAAVNRALEGTVEAEEASELLQQAAAKFQSMAAVAHLNWGNTYVWMARRRLGLKPAPETAQTTTAAAAAATGNTEEDGTKADEGSIESGKAERRAAKLGEVEAARGVLEQAREKYEAALTVQPNLPDALLALGQCFVEMARAEEFLAVLEGEEGEEGQEGEKGEKGDKKEKGEGEKGSEGGEGKKRMRGVLECLAQAEENFTAAVKDAFLADVAAFRQNVNLQLANCVFDKSQVQFKLSDAGWESSLKAAVAAFKEVGVSEEEVQRVLATHASSQAGSSPPQS